MSRILSHAGRLGYFAGRLMLDAIGCVARCCGTTRWWRCLSCGIYCDDEVQQIIYIRYPAVCSQSGSPIGLGTVISINDKCFYVAAGPMTLPPDNPWPTYVQPQYECKSSCDQCQPLQYLRGKPCDPGFNPSRYPWVCDKGRCCTLAAIDGQCWRFDPATSPRSATPPQAPDILVANCEIPARTCCECQTGCFAQHFDAPSVLCPSGPITYPLDCCCVTQARCFYIDYHARFEAFPIPGPGYNFPTIEIRTCAGFFCKDAQGNFPPVLVTINRRVYDNSVGGYVETTRQEPMPYSVFCVPSVGFVDGDCATTDHCGVYGEVRHQWSEFRTCNYYAGRYSYECQFPPPDIFVFGNRQATESGLISVQFDDGPCSDDDCFTRQVIPIPAPPPSDGGGGPLPPSPILQRSRNVSTSRQTVDREFGFRGMI